MHNSRADTLMNDDVGGHASAVFSPCMTWRYTCMRNYADLISTPRSVLWIMLNPSTADHIKLDPTLTRVREFTRAWGYNRFVVCNVFALRSTAPSALYEHADPVGPGNDFYIDQEAARADLIVCAWGNHAGLHQRGDTVAHRLRSAGRRLHALVINGTGHPAHPLYLPATLLPQPWAGRR